MSEDDHDQGDFEEIEEDDGFGEPRKVRRAKDHRHLLHVFRDLRVFVDPSRLDEIADAAAELLTAPWRRANEHDKTELNRGMVDWRVFERDADAALPGALLFLVPHSRDGHLYVSNVVPTKGHSLGVENYNAILAEFTSRFVRPVAVSNDFSFELTADWVDIAEDLGEVAFGALVAASIFPDGTHPTDIERWMKFILTARREHLDVDTELLARWLEAEGFTPDRAFDRVMEFDFALRLLDLYDRF